MLLLPACLSATNTTAIRPSTDSESHWYVLRNANRTNAVLTDEGAGAQVYGRVYSKQTSQMWRFVSIGGGVYRIESRNGRMLSSSGGTDEVVYANYGTANTAMKPALSADKSKWSIVPVGQTANAVHFTRTAQLPYYCITWQASSVDSYWTIEDVADVDVPATTQSDLSNFTTQLKSYLTLEVGTSMGQLKSLAAVQAAIADVANWTNLIGQSYNTFLARRAALVATLFVSPKRISLDTPFVIRIRSAYPDYNYVSDGRYLGSPTTASGTMLRLYSDYNYKRCRFFMHTDLAGRNYLTFSNDTSYIYLSGSAFRIANGSDPTYTKDRYMGFYSDDEVTSPNSHVVWVADSMAITDAEASARCAKSNTNGNSINCLTAPVSIADNMVFHLIPLPATNLIQPLSDAIDTLNARFGISGSGNAQMDSILTWATNELNYVYLSSEDAAKALQTLNKSYEDFTSGKAKAVNTTDVRTTQAAAQQISVVNRRIYVNGKTPEHVYDAAGHRMANSAALQPGIYIVDHHAVSTKVVVR